MHWDGTAYVLGEPPAPPEGKPLLCLPDIVGSGDAVWIVEGEKQVAALAEIGILATTSGGASSAEAADWTPLAGRHCVIWPDNDAEGLKYGNTVAAKLSGLGCAVEIVDVSSLGLPKKGDCVDWLKAKPLSTAIDVGALPRLPQESQSRESRNAPEPLRRPVPASEPYPIAELGPILAPACESIRRVIQAPDAVCGAAVLAAASLSVQSLANVEIDGRIYPLSLWMLTVAESGERKSAVDAEAIRAARDFEKEMTASYVDALATHESECEEWQARRDHAKADKRKAGGVGLADALREIGAQPEPPLRPSLIVADFTAEGIAKLLASGRPGIGVFTDEAALVFGGHGMSKETTTRTAGTLCKLWDSGTLDRVRATDGAMKLWGRRLAMHMLAQPVIAERALSDDVLAGQGFLARCLLSWPEPTAGTRAYKSENLQEDAAVIRCNAIFTDLLRMQLPLADGTRNELAPRSLTLTDEAKHSWRILYDAVEAKMAPNGRFATVKPWASKTPEQCLRIAGVLTLLDSPSATTIQASTVSRAAEIALWHLNEAVRLSGTAEVPPEVRDAEALLKWCHETGRELLHSRDALRLGPSRVRDRERFISAMDALERAGWAEVVEGGAPLDGAHRRNVWRITSLAEER